MNCTSAQADYERTKLLCFDASRCLLSPLPRLSCFPYLSISPVRNKIQIFLFTSFSGLWERHGVWKCSLFDSALRNFRTGCERCRVGEIANQGWQASERCRCSRPGKNFENLLSLHFAPWISEASLWKVAPESFPLDADVGQLSIFERPPFQLSIWDQQAYQLGLFPNNTSISDSYFAAIYDFGTFRHLDLLYTFFISAYCDAMILQISYNLENFVGTWRPYP